MTQTLERNNGLGILEEPFYYLKCERIGMAKVGAQPSKIEESQIEKEGSRIYQKKSMQTCRAGLILVSPHGWPHLAAFMYLGKMK